MQTLLEKIREKRVLVVGDIMLDHYIHGDATRISPEAPVPVVSVVRDRFVAGGAANVALNLRSLGAETVLCGLFGNDSAGDDLAKILSEKKISVPAAFRRDDVRTIIKSRVVVRNQQLCRLDREGVPASYALASPAVRGALLDEISRADAVIVSDYAKGTVDMPLLAEVLEAAKKREILVSLDPKPRRRLPFEDVGLLTPNRDEAIELAGIGDEISAADPFPAEEICRRIWEKHHPKMLVVTLGAGGMLLSTNGKVGKRIPTFAREVFDVSGAGDTVIASLTLALAAGASLEDAAHFANTAAGIVVGKFGTATVSPEEILAFRA